ncbi:phosphatase PAP2 family protein [Streptomyces sp. NPDC047928]|uniref:phosphatase PAP2 family protein n=1 Tax=unclassified Streptomyces TaxID=2593676 RepID=UPI0037221CB3
MPVGIRPAAPEATGTPPRPPLVRELLLVTALFLVYKLGRLFANGHEARAFGNADRVWHLERTLHVPGEGAVQRLLLHDGTTVHLANTYYAAVHFPATVAFLGWLYWRRPAHYLWARRVLALLTAAALALHLLVPLAPPRLLTASGLVDTARVYGPSVYGAVPMSDAMANQFAAMPSLHFGWALMIAIGLIAAAGRPGDERGRAQNQGRGRGRGRGRMRGRVRGRVRYLWLLHPLVTLLVIVGTANHYWLDALVAAVLLGCALLLVRRPRPRAGDAPLAAGPPGGTATALPGGVIAARVPAGGVRR